MKSIWIAIAALTAWTRSGAGGAAEPKPFIKTAPPCGSAADLYFCDTIDQNREFSLNAIQLKFPAAGTALVTWSGNVFCDVTDVDNGGPANSLIEYYVHLVLTPGASLGQYNEPGSASVGERLSVQSTSNVGTARTVLTPVTLTRVFQITEKSIGTYRVIAVGDFRKVSRGFCNVNGGAMSVHYTPAR